MTTNIQNNKIIKNAFKNKKIKDAKIISNKLNEIFELNEIQIDKNDCICFPYGMVVYNDQDTVWDFSIDFALFNDHFDVFMIMIVLNELILTGVTLRILQGVKSLFNKNGIYMGFVDMYDVTQISIEKNISEKKAIKLAPIIK